MIFDKKSPENWERTDCPACQCNQGFIFLKLPLNPAHHLFKCPECGLIFLSPRPTFHAIHHYYPVDYAPHSEPIQRKKQKHTSKEFSLPPPFKNAKLLDYGCGNGAFLVKIKNLGWDVTGVDFSPHAVQLTKASGIRAFQGDLNNPILEQQKFDCITLRQVLEHLHNPVETLLNAKKLLAPKGKISISVPNIQSLPFHWFKEDWLGVDFPRHLLHFNPESLQKTLKKAGLKIIQMQQIRHSSWLKQSAEIALKAKGFHLRGWLASKKMGASLISFWAKLTNQCDCIQVLAEDED